MKRMQSWRWMPAALLLAVGGTTVRSEEFAITSFSGTGRLTFSEIPTATAYRVEWAPSPAGPWTNFTGRAGVWLDAIPGAGSGIVTCSVPMCYRVVASTDTMSLIPGGCFVMGNAMYAAEGNTDERPVHVVNVSAFYMDKYEVTKAKWNGVREWAVEVFHTDLPEGAGKGENYPVHSVSWEEALKWCNARSLKEGLTPCYTNADGSTYKTGAFSGGCDWAARGYRLPTEAEWEKAARVGVGGHRFPWNDSDEVQHARANYKSSAVYAYDTSPTRGYHPDYDNDPTPYTSPVGSFAPNGYGLYDMAGNVWEWCWDLYGSSYYGESPETDPRGAVSHVIHMLRGGSWLHNCRVADRNYNLPDNHTDSYGFRTVLRPGP